MATKIKSAWTVEQAREVITLQARAVDLLNQVGAFDPSSPSKTTEEFLANVEERFTLVTLDPEHSDRRRAGLLVTMVGHAGLSIENGIKGVVLALISESESLVAGIPTPTPNGEEPSTEFIIDRMTLASELLNEAFDRAKQIEDENVAAGRLLENLLD